MEKEEYIHWDKDSDIVGIVSGDIVRSLIEHGVAHNSVKYFIGGLESVISVFEDYVITSNDKKYRFYEGDFLHVKEK